MTQHRCVPQIYSMCKGIYVLVIICIYILSITPHSPGIRTLNQEDWEDLLTQASPRTLAHKTGTRNAGKKATESKKETTKNTGGSGDSPQSELPKPKLRVSRCLL